MALLPDEVWQYILYHATDNLARRTWKHVDPMEIQPFETFHEVAERDSADKAMIVKTSVFLVCKRWQILSAKFLFEDIRIRQGSYALARKLEEPLIPSSNITVGTHVRRIIIPVDMTGLWPKTVEVNARRILLACPNTLILARRKENLQKREPRRRDFGKQSINDVQMPRLRRVDWDNAPASYLYDRYIKLKGMPTFIWNVPSLEILSVSQNAEGRETAFTKRFPWCSDGRTNAAVSTSLTTIHTLRLDCCVDPDTVEILQKRLLSLRHLVVNVSQGATFKTSFLDAIGPQLQVVEIATYPPSFPLESEYMLWKDVLASCPNIRSLHLHVREFPVSRLSTELPPIKCEKLKEMKLLMLREDNARGQLEPKKQALYDKLLSIIEDRVYFPSLSQVELHGSMWIPWYNEAMGELQLAAEKNQIVLSFQSVES